MSGPNTLPAPLRAARAHTSKEKTRLLEQIVGAGTVEHDIASELSNVRPLWRPAELEPIHRMAMRSLAVLDRNGVAGPASRGSDR